MKIFRNFRVSELLQKNFKRYLIYAFGEIILVVLGILIALQLNNANELRKNRNVQRKALTELKAGLQKDLNYLKTELNACNKIEYNTVQYLTWILGEVISTDSLKYFAGSVSTIRTFNRINGPYETLKQIGLQNIENDSLKLQIRNLYENEYPRYITTQNLRNDNASLVGKLSAKYLEYENWGIATIVNHKNLKRDREYKYHLSGLIGLTWHFVERRIKPTMNEIEKTIALNEKELNS